MPKMFMVKYRHTNLYHIDMEEIRLWTLKCAPFVKYSQCIPLPLCVQSIEKGARSLQVSKCCEFGEWLYTHLCDEEYDLVSIEDEYYTPITDEQCNKCSPKLWCHPPPTIYDTVQKYTKDAIIPMIRPIITDARCDRTFTSNARKLLGRALPPKVEGWVDPPIELQQMHALPHP
jgi:hypothetical protein